MAILDVKGIGLYAAVLLAVHWERTSGMHIIHLPSVDIRVWPDSSRLLFYICSLCYLLTHCYASVFIICLYYVRNLLLSDWLKPIYCSLPPARRDLSLPLAFKRLLGRRLGGWGRALANKTLCTFCSFSAGFSVQCHQSRYLENNAFFLLCRPCWGLRFRRKYTLEYIPLLPASAKQWNYFCHQYEQAVCCVYSVTPLPEAAGNYTRAFKSSFILGYFYCAYLEFRVLSCTIVFVTYSIFILRFLCLRC